MRPSHDHARSRFAMPLVTFAGALLCVLMLATSTIRAATPDDERIPPVPALPPLSSEGHLERAGARIWHASLGAGPPVVLLHGGRASRRSWGYQVPALVAAGYRVILVDSRGHGASTLGTKPLSYELLADDVTALIDRLQLDRPVIVGWSDGGIVALILAMRDGARLGGVFAYGANMDRQANRPDAGNAPIVAQIGPMLVQDYLELSSGDLGFAEFSDAVRGMQHRQRDYTVADLSAINGVEVAIVAGEEDEFILAQHPIDLARHIPASGLHLLPDTGHFAPWQKPEAFNRVLLDFLAGLD